MSVRCIYYGVTTENQSPFGSGEYWPMTTRECFFEPEDEELIKQFEQYGSCDVGCPGYEAEPTGYCSKHGTYELRNGCEGCWGDAMYREYMEAMESRHRQEMPKGA